jgi:hypothetical protein
MARQSEPFNSKDEESVASTSTKMKTRRRQKLSRQNRYRCPACGEWVDNNDHTAVRLHHQHVLRAPQDGFVRLPFYDPIATAE